MHLGKPQKVPALMASPARPYPSPQLPSILMTIGSFFLVFLNGLAISGGTFFAASFNLMKENR